jgi:hypothetical protein
VCVCVCVCVCEWKGGCIEIYDILSLWSVLCLINQVSFVSVDKKDEDDFLFGSYQPSAVGSSTGGNSRPSSRRSVR